MERAAVESSLIRSAGYDVLKQEMEVEFLNGAVVVYHGVGVEEWGRFMAAESKGGFLAKEIKGNREFEYKKSEEGG